MAPPLTTAKLDRAAGVLLGLACGDALGVALASGSWVPDNVPPASGGVGSFGRTPTDWVDVTSMAIAIAEITAEAGSLSAGSSRDRIVARWAAWAGEAASVDAQTRALLATATRHARSRGRDVPTGCDLELAVHEDRVATRRSAGAGSLVWTVPAALALLDRPAELIKTAYPLSAMMHLDPQDGWACIAWCLAIRHVVLGGTLEGLRRELNKWVCDPAVDALMDQAEAGHPGDFTRNEGVARFMQGAWSAVTATASPDPDFRSSTAGPVHFRRAMEEAVRGGGDTGAVASLVGSLLGGLYGASAVPAEWRRGLHGWPGLRARDLIALGVASARGGRPDSVGWPMGARTDYSSYRSRDVLARHPHDGGVWLGGVDALNGLPGGVDAVVSLCRLGTAQVPAQGVAPRDHVEVWLIDDEDPAENPNLDFVLTDAVAALASLRAEGKTVLLHGVQAHSRTPAVAALHSALNCGVPLEQALADVRRTLPDARPNPGFLAALERLAGASR